VYLHSGALSRVHQLRSLTSLQVISGTVRSSIYRYVAKATQLRLLQLDVDKPKSLIATRSTEEVSRLQTLTNLAGLSLPYLKAPQALDLLSKLTKLQTLHLGKLEDLNEELLRELVTADKRFANLFLGELHYKGQRHILVAILSFSWAELGIFEFLLKVSFSYPSHPLLFHSHYMFLFS